MIDNLRRSLVAPATLAARLAGWMLPLPQAAIWTACLLTLLMLGRLLPLPFALLPGRAGVTSGSHGAALLADLAVEGGQVGLGVVFLPDAAWRMRDAILRTAWRLGVSRRNLLDWVTAAQTHGARRPTMAGQYRLMAGGTAPGLMGQALAVAVNPAVLPLALPVAVLWLAAPAGTALASRPWPPRGTARLRPVEIARLRQIARKTWRYFGLRSQSHPRPSLPPHPPPRPLPRWRASSGAGKGPWSDARDLRERLGTARAHDPRNPDPIPQPASGDCPGPCPPLRNADGAALWAGGGLHCHGAACLVCASGSGQGGRGRRMPT